MVSKMLAYTQRSDVQPSFELAPQSTQPPAPSTSYPRYPRHFCRNSRKRLSKAFPTAKAYLAHKAASESIDLLIYPKGLHQYLKENGAMKSVERRISCDYLLRKMEEEWKR